MDSEHHSPTCMPACLQDQEEAGEPMEEDGKEAAAGGDASKVGGGEEGWGGLKAAYHTTVGC